MTRVEQFEHQLRKKYVEWDMPDYMYEGLSKYLIDGQKPGDFLWAVLTNDFVGAVCGADGTNSQMLVEWARFIYNEIPSPAWKSEEAVREWISRGGYNGIYPFANDEVTQ